MAQMPFSPCAPNNGPCSDSTVIMLQRIFGDVITALTTGADPNSVGMGGNLLATMFSSFNTGILILASIVVSYTALMGVANTANDGEAMGKSWSSLWTPVRIVFGGTVLLPTASGYSFIQLIILMLSLWGVGFANSVYKAGVNLGVLSPNGLVQGVNSPGTFYGLREFGKQYVAVSYCARSANTIYADTGLIPQVRVNGGSASVPDKVITVNGRTDTTFFIKDRNPISNLAGGQPFCGTVNVSSYVAQPRADATAEAMESMHAAVQNQKIIAVVGMMKAIDQWVETWPSDINKSGWDAVDSEEFNRIVKTYEDQIPAQLIAAVSGSQSGVDAGMMAALNALTEDGWASAGGWFQRVGMMRGQISGILSASVGSVTPPSLSGLPSDLRTILLANSVSTVTDTINRKAEEKPSYAASNTPKPEDMASLIPKDASSDINPGSIRANMDAKMSSFVNQTMTNVVEMATGANGTGQTPLCGSAGQMGGSLNRMKCIGDYLAVAKLGIALADVAIKTGATALRVLAGGASGVKVLGTGVELDKVVTPLWDWIIEVPIKQLGILASYIEPLAFYFGVFLPSLPYTVFMIVVAGWVLAVLQSVIAAPLWAMMHMTPDKTFIGSQTQGYLLGLSLFARPVLAILGLFAAVIVSDPIIDYIAKGFFAMRGAVVSSTGGVGAIAEFLTFAWWLIVFGLTLLPVLYMTYGLPQILPDHVLKWIGAGLGDLGETNAVNSMRGGMAAAGSGAAIAGDRNKSKLKLGGGTPGPANGGGGNSPRPGGSKPISGGPQGVVSDGEGPNQGGPSSSSNGAPGNANNARLRDRIGEAAGIALGRGIIDGGAATGRAVKNAATNGVLSAAPAFASDISGAARNALSEGKKAFNEGANSRLQSYRSKSGSNATFDNQMSNPPVDSEDSGSFEDRPYLGYGSNDMNPGASSDPYSTNVNTSNDGGQILRQEEPPERSD